MIPNILILEQNGAMKWIRFLLVVMSITTLAGCMDMTEEVTFNDDGSGSYRMTMDFSKMMELMGDMVANEENDFGEEMSKSFEQTMAELNKLEGISDVVYTAEGDKYTISYNFANLAALNKAIALNASEDGLTPKNAFGTGPTFIWEKNKIQRVAIESNDKDTEELSPEMIDAMLGNASYVSIYHFPRSVKKVSNKKAEISEDKKTVVLNIPLTELITGETQVANTIKLKH